ncbi:MAG: DciA family protein [Candidatus Falkowbacteria bacterium]
MKKNFQHIGMVLDDKMMSAPWARQVKIGMVIGFAQTLLHEIWGAAIDNQVKIVAIKNKELMIHCSNSIISQEIRLREARITNAIIAKFGKVVEKIRFV